jgi:hypothetical protein
MRLVVSFPESYSKLDLDNKFLHHDNKQKSGREWGELKAQRVFSGKTGPQWPHLEVKKI